MHSRIPIFKSPYTWCPKTMLSPPHRTIESMKTLLNMVFVWDKILVKCKTQYSGLFWAETSSDVLTGRLISRLCSRPVICNDVFGIWHVGRRICCVVFCISWMRWCIWHLWQISSLPSRMIQCISYFQWDLWLIGGLCDRRCDRYWSLVDLQRSIAI